MSLAVADDLLCCDCLGRVRLIVGLSREVRHLAIATLGMICGDMICWCCDWTSYIYLDIYLFSVYGWYKYLCCHAPF